MRLKAKRESAYQLGLLLTKAIAVCLYKDQFQINMHIEEN
jgi:hypothetical protein